MNRVERIKSYCCIGLFSSVEEAGDEDVHIRFTNFRGEGIWFIETPAKVVGGGNMISNCPWCGNRLPKTPHVNVS